MKTEEDEVYLHRDARKVFLYGHIEKLTDTIDSLIKRISVLEDNLIESTKIGYAHINSERLVMSDHTPTSSE